MTDSNSQENTIELLTCDPSEYAAIDGRGITAYRLVGISTEDNLFEDLKGKEKNEEIRAVIDRYWGNPRAYLIERAQKLRYSTIVNLVPVFDSYHNRLRYSGAGMILKTDKIKAKGEQP